MSATFAAVLGVALLLAVALMAAVAMASTAVGGMQQIAAVIP